MLKLDYSHSSYLTIRNELGGFLQTSYDEAETLIVVLGQIMDARRRKAEVVGAVTTVDIGVYKKEVLGLESTNQAR